jgi:hypothetical protein
MYIRQALYTLLYSQLFFSCSSVTFQIKFPYQICNLQIFSPFCGWWSLFTFFFCGVGDQTQSLVHVRKMLYPGPHLQLFSHFFSLFCLLFDSGSYYVSNAGLKLKILVPQSLECWDYSFEPPCPASKHFFNNLLNNITMAIKF